VRVPCLITAFLCAGIAIANADTPIAGQYIEDRSARVYGCPCEWSNDLVAGGREAVLAWNIQSGVFEGQDLAGLRVVAVVVADYNVTEQTVARRAVLFEDERASPPQRRTGTRWIRSRFGEVLGHVLGEHVMAIEFVLGAEAISVKVGDVLTLSMRPALLSQDTQTWASLLYEPMIQLAASNLGTTSLLRYSGPDLNVRWKREESAITGYYGTFRLK